MPFDHFETTECGKTVDPAYARAVQADQTEESESVKGMVRVSDATGCPRKRAIFEHENVAVDPLAYNSSMTGKAWHALLEAHGKDIEGYETERRLAGDLGGIKVTGKPDRLVKAAGRVEDHKNQNDFATKNPRPKPEWIGQLSLYAELSEQALGWRPTIGRIRAHFSTQFPPADDFPLWGLELAMDNKPWNGEWKSRELLRYTRMLLNKEHKWQDAPLFGKTMMFGKTNTMCDYCAVRGPCTQAVNGAPF